MPRYPPGKWAHYNAWSVFLSVSEDTQLNLGSSDSNNPLAIKGKGKDNPSNDVPGLLYVQGTCNMYSGVTLANRVGNNYFGGGVTVQGGTFHMYGGTIENCGIRGGSVCYGGGVAVIYGGSFVMDAGEIKNCYAESSAKDYWDPNRCITAMGGGVFVSGGSSFVMNGGIIANNNATNMGGGIAIVASDVEVGNGFGTLKSSVDLCGGTIKENVAHDGADVFASSYYYAWAPALCANTPSIGAQEKQGLRIKGTNILDNKADQQDGRGGGVFTVMLKAPAAVQISNATIGGNSAAIGGGVMSYGYYTAMNIDGSAITGNTATTYGGGLAADTNTGESAGTTVTNTKLCNNTAAMAASDVYLNDAAMKLSSAKDMNEQYLGQPDDATNQKIDGWHLDDEASRYSAQLKAERSECTNYGSIESGNKVCLIAANNPTLAKVTFTNEDGSVIYSETHYAVGTKADQIAIPTPTKPSDDTYDYYFDSWHIAGMAFTSIFTAGMNTILIVNPDAYVGASGFLIGGLSGVKLDELIVPSCAICAVLVLGLLQGTQLNLLSLGEHQAHSLGLNVRRTRLVALVSAAALAGCAVSFAGLIGFVGLIVPHAVRTLVGHDNRRVLAMAPLLGGLLVCLCDLLARTLFSPYEIPVGIVLSLLGGPFFVYLILRCGKGGLNG